MKITHKEVVDACTRQSLPYNQAGIDMVLGVLGRLQIEVEPAPPPEPELPPGPWRAGIHASGSGMISAGRITYYSTEPLGRRMISAAIAAYNAQPAAIPEQEREAVRRAVSCVPRSWVSTAVYDTLPAWAREEPK